MLSSPIWLIVIIALVIDSPGAPFFAHTRVGRNGKLFRLVKFRTMTPSASVGSEVTVSGDYRVTGIGRLLRRYKLDELPQLLNILSGSMTIVGPRPETPGFVSHYTIAQRKILDYKPGLTDPASLKYRHEEQVLAAFPDPIASYIQTVLPDKIRISLDYQKNRSACSDIKIVAATAAAIFRRHEK
jgi:lipopolysaccharide/colanic/teichoic acid biosynthesis glycosyltransferase